MSDQDATLHAATAARQAEQDLASRWRPDVAPDGVLARVQAADDEHAAAWSEHARTDPPPTDLGTAELRLRLEEVTEQRDRAVELLSSIHQAGMLDVPQGQVAGDLRRAVLRLVREVGFTPLYRRHEARLRRIVPPSGLRHATRNAVLAELLDR